MKQNLRLSLLLALLVLGSGAWSGCNRAQQGSAIGAGLGAGAGAIIGHQTGNRGEGALIGGAVGALGGYAVGNEMDKNDQNKRINRLEGQGQYQQRPNNDNYYQQPRR